MTDRSVMIKKIFSARLVMRLHRACAPFIKKTLGGLRTVPYEKLSSGFAEELKGFCSSLALQ